MDKNEIMKRVDHTLLTQTATWEEIERICSQAIKYKTASVCIAPSYVKRASEYLAKKIPVCTVIGFPNGYQTTKVKMAETEDALKSMISSNVAPAVEKPVEVLIKSAPLSETT